MVIMNDLEWSMLSYYVIYYEKFRKVMQRTEKVALCPIPACILYLSHISHNKGDMQCPLYLVYNSQADHTLAQSCSCFEPCLAFATGTTSKHQRIIWPGLYRKLIECLGIVVRVSVRQLEVTWLVWGRPVCQSTERMVVMYAP